MLRVSLYAAWAVVVGALIPIMGVLNARLARALGEPTRAPVIVFLVGLFATVLVSSLVSGRLPDARALGRASPMDFAGGLIMASYVIMATSLAPRLGIGKVILFAVSAQIIVAAAIDHFGLLGAVPRPLSATRLAGIVLLLAGLAITQVRAASSAESPPERLP